jgi:FkbM family methyltransferase
MKVIIEVGANSGEDTVKYAEQGKLFTFEPVPSMAENLRKMFSENKNVIVIEKAVSDFNGTSRFGISDPHRGCANMGCSSLNEFTDGIHDLWKGRPDFNHVEYLEVNVIRMDTFIEENGITEVEYLHCDAQGSDFKVIQSFGDKLKILKAGRCEAANKVALYKDTDNSVYSIIMFLENNGFKITKLNNHFHQEISREDLPTSTEEVDIHFERIIE